MPSNDAVLTLTQALQLVGLVPCLFIVVFLLFLLRRNKQVILPAAYFLSLACAFAGPLIDALFPYAPMPLASSLLLAGESLLVAFGFLMILQFLQGRVPSWPYWLVLAIPLVGGSLMIYANMVQGECRANQVCDDIESIRVLYNVFGSLLVLLLLVYYIARFTGFTKDDATSRHKYAFILSLISLHVLVLAVKLVQLAGQLSPMQALAIETVFRLSFIYIVITSLFRVFYPSLMTQTTVVAPPPYDPAQDLPHVAILQELLAGGVHREMRLNRARLAKKAGIGEHHLSRVINHHFKKSFNELINSYRIDEAKQRLKNEQTPITTIAFEVGFNSIASFNRVFKESVGVSPTEFRASNPS
jgi:AraC-like DNA-binding protein